MEMVNQAAYADLQEAGMDNAQALTIAAHIPAGTQFTTRQDLLRMEVRLLLYMVGLVGVYSVIDKLGP